MIDKIDIGNLVTLARLEISEGEREKLEKEIPDILAFVDIIQKANVSAEIESSEHRNVMREDQNPHEAGAYTEKLLEGAPSREGDRIAVKQVVSRNKKT